MTTAAPKVFHAEPYAYDAVEILMAELGVSEPIAITLVRRGLGDPATAREFLAADERHDPSSFAGMEAVCARISRAITDDTAITVHGDFDVDGVCATAILVGALRELGARCDWFIPDRAADGYGLRLATVERLAERGTGLLITVDCGIGSVAEVRAAQAAGMEVIVTDHHSPGDELPPCDILHPVVSNYPCQELSGTGVAFKLACALREAAGADTDPEADLDLVALATVADLVALRGENRSLVRQGLRVARRAQRPGLRALMEVSRTTPSRLDETDMAFRLAPRINAAGRLYRADAGVELMLTADSERAREVAAELDSANYERRATEREVQGEAMTAWRALADHRDDIGLVVAGDGWHPGVIGIVASRLVEELDRPAIVISIDAEGRGRGSGRSVKGFDLLGALRACAEHLDRYGGHRAAAGLEIAADKIEPFREAFAAEAQRQLGGSDRVASRRVDAMVGCDQLGLALAEELDQLRPFGQGNPGVSFLVPGAQLDDVRPMGAEGRHVRFQLRTGGSGARGVGFGTGPKLAATPDERIDVAVRLEVNEFNGAVEPRVVLGDLYRGESVTAPCAGSCAEVAAPWWNRWETELAAPPEGPGSAAIEGAVRAEVARHGRSAVAALAELASSGAGVLCLAADAHRRRALVEEVVPAVRYGAGTAVVLSEACVDGCLPAELPRLVLADWGTLDHHPELVKAFAHVLAVDPAPSQQLHRRALAADTAGGGWMHLAWGPGEVAFAGQAHDASWAVRDHAATVFRGLRAAGGHADTQALASLLPGPAGRPPVPEQSARSIRVLDELGLCAVEGLPGDRSLRVVSSEATQLDRSEAFRAYERRRDEGTRWLSTQTPRR
ncbi:MAG: single-stranded-DNA-specific exonuclease RecJ [Solirubrobacterales bacterium]